MAMIIYLNAISKYFHKRNKAYDKFYEFYTNNTKCKYYMVLFNPTNTENSVPTKFYFY